jgi:hypothetical protein
MTENKRYKITLVVDTNVHPRKWIADVIDDVIGPYEELVDWETEEVSSDFELLSSINDVSN